MGRTHSSEKGWTLGSQGVGRAATHALVDPPTSWTDDIKRVAGSRWIRAAQIRGIWNSLQKTYGRRLSA
ncbi:jg7462 [Pararge aegeria aegeria]|uniref:Jg7462 protein n=1 Tax=Pararge aegeria aegeria TaxID=348720 RepID=A0A8S4RC80_9NEOP|nr:jg7462 [Pararge aegeria aegeria]